MVVAALVAMTGTAPASAALVGQSISTKGDLNDGFAAFQDRLVEYAEQQGFTVDWLN